MPEITTAPNRDSVVLFFMHKSPRKQFLDLIAPRWRIPRCNFGNVHNAGLCMGSTVPENLGRRYFYVCDWPFEWMTT